MPASADSLTLYHPMTLQSMPNTPGHHVSSYDMNSRHMLNVPSRHHIGPGAGMDYGHSRNMYHSAGPTQSPHYMSSDVPLSAPPSLSSGNPFSSHHSSHQQNLYPSLVPSPRLPPSSNSQQHYYDGPSHSGSAPGSGYATPQ